MQASILLAAVSASSAPLVAAVWIAFALLTGGEGEVGVRSVSSFLADGEKSQE